MDQALKKQEIINLEELDSLQAEVMEQSPIAM